jgi:hypothetical protein
MSKTAADTATNELIRHAIAAWGYGALGFPPDPGRVCGRDPPSLVP